MISVIDDDRFAQDKQFYMRLGLVDNNVSKENVVLGRVFLMEINIMNDNGSLRNKHYTVIQDIFMILLSLYFRTRLCNF